MTRSIEEIVAGFAKTLSALDPESRRELWVAAKETAARADASPEDRACGERLADLLDAYDLDGSPGALRTALLAYHGTVGRRHVRVNFTSERQPA